ncbi:MAG: hypothetical protein AB1813_13365 [Verrucomicrobiota bacterium]
MSLNKGLGSGFVQDGETFCCRGCAEGTGCTCLSTPAAKRKAFNRPGSLGHRNPENTFRDRNQNRELDTSGRRIGERHPTEKAPRPQQNRGERMAGGAKRPRSQSEERPSTRTQARGQSELRGRMNKRRLRTGEVDRVANTGTKSV